MIETTDDIASRKLEAKALAPLITELNIARRNSSAYPKGHPVIVASLAKVLRVYEGLLQGHDEIILGVTSDALMLDGIVLEKSNRVYRDFSRVLFERGIGALLLHGGVTIEELNSFTTISGLKREQIQQHGGIEAIWAKAGISAMTIRPIRYDLFTTTDQGSVTAEPASGQEERLWDRFAQELTQFHLPPGEDGETSLDPEILAGILNKKYSDGEIDESDIRAAISDFFDSVTGSLMPETPVSNSYEELAAFASNLAPELRRQFLDSSFGADNMERYTAAEQILTRLSDSAIMESLDDISQNRLNVSSVVFGLLQRLSANAGSLNREAEEETGDDEISHKMKTIFREHDSEAFVPESYQRKLDRIIASDQIPCLALEKVPELLTTMENGSVEASIGQILMNLIREGIESPDERDMLLRSLTDMFRFYLQTGDYGQLHTMINQFTDEAFPAEFQSRLREEYERREFLEEVLDGLTIWGKPRYGDIHSLIFKIGAPIVGALLDRLSEEQTMSLRRFYMDCLIEMGPVTRESIFDRLHRDTRWYFLRNLVVILSSQNDPSVAAQIRPLLRSTDQRLRHEALKTLVHFRDPQAEKLVMDHLNSQDQEVQTTAIQLAEQCASPAIVTQLTTILAQGGYSKDDCDKKSVIVHTLGEIGRVEALPELAKILSSRSLLHSRQLSKLKAVIINSLPKYPVKYSRPVLERIAAGSDNTAPLAKEALQILSGTHE